ncbi:hypothetical protein PVA45_07245 (plasmid) [Entomospira entomophila]|uniref:Tail sheath protein n=1 Tax=Entomospira entomophila TaxID=2719988 RepID=A0A968GB04_9SPIO|nr:hypothetical protein [Entomospira entomophilus]NIZ41346.1 hypothetical protein [Entomospira entomophilus]WDI36243.1 hypothetical protein PVA45_07245 [Entomospira entomophilus]
MSSVSNTVRASGNFFEHAGGDRTAQKLEQKLLIVGHSNTLGENTAHWKPKRIITIDQARTSYGVDSELTKYLTFAISNYPLLTVYGVAMPVTAKAGDNPATGDEGEPAPLAAKAYDFEKLFKEMADTFYTKMVIPFYDVNVLVDIKQLAEKRNDPSIYRPISIIAPSNLSFEAQLEAPKQYNSPYINLIYLEGCPDEELGMLAVSAAAAMASFDSGHLGRPYKTLPVREINYRPENNYVYAQTDALVQAGSSWLRMDNAGQLLLGDVCSTYRLDADGFTDETWYFAEMMANYQSKLFDMEFLIKSRYSQVIFVPNNSTTRRDNVVKPNDVKLAIMGLMRGWESDALSVNIDQVIDTLKVQFNPNNPARMDIQFIDQMSVGGRIFTVTYSHGFNKESE